MSTLRSGRAPPSNRLARAVPLGRSSARPRSEAAPGDALRGRRAGRPALQRQLILPHRAYIRRRVAERRTGSIAATRSGTASALAGATAPPVPPACRACRRGYRRAGCGGALELANHRVQCGVSVVGRALVNAAACAAARGCVCWKAPRLSATCRFRVRRRAEPPAVAGAGTLPAPFEDVDLLWRPDARRQRARVRRFEALSIGRGASTCLGT